MNSRVYGAAEHKDIQSNQHKYVKIDPQSSGGEETLSLFVEEATRSDLCSVSILPCADVTSQEDESGGKPVQDEGIF